MNPFLDGLNAAMTAEAVGGRLLGNPDVPITRARADSRVCRPGDMFVALPGERTHGSLYAAAAWKAGAGTVLASASRKHPVPGPSQALILVDKPLTALQELAARSRREAGNLTVVGITGSSGKTTTKNILAAILASWIADDLLVSEGNYNSEVGLPLTLMNLRSRHRIAVLEMGLNRIGEMPLLARLAQPRIGVITNIGSAHVGLVGSREALVREKRSIFDGAASSSIAVIGAAEPQREFLTENFPGTVRFFGEWGRGGWESYEDRGLDGSVLRRQGRRITFGLPGMHNLLNAMAAVEAAAALGAPDSVIAAGLESVKPAFGRSEVIRGEITVLRDCYNANPESLAAALELFSAAESRGRKYIVLGELLELGAETEEAMRFAGRAMAETRADAVLLFGESLEPVEETMRNEGFQGKIQRSGDIETIKRAIGDWVKPGDTVLLKGSRGSALERLEGTLSAIGAG